MTDSNLSIEAYFKQEGLKAYTDSKQFWSWANKRIGASLVNQYLFLLEQRAKGEGLGETGFYDFIAPHKIARVANSFELGLLQNILEWVAPKLPQAGTILELGCHTGLLSRYYALARPNARVIGIDISQPAIESAKEIAQEKGINNLSFLQADLLNSQDVLPDPVNCIVSGRVLGELMTAAVRYQQSWDQIAYPPIREDLDSNAKSVLAFCATKISRNGLLLITERFSDYDRLNRIWRLTQLAGLQPSPDSITPVAWTDIAGAHKTWFFEARKANGPLFDFDSLDPLEIPLPSREGEIANDETRILFKGLLAYQTWFSLDHARVHSKSLIRWANGLEEHIELGETGNGLGYAFIGNNIGNYLLTLFLKFELDAVKTDIEEYTKHLLKSGAKIT